MATAPRDSNFVPTMLGVSSVDLSTPVTIAVDPTTHRVLTNVAVSSNLQTDVFTSSNLQTIFTASQNVAYTIFLSINGSIQTPNTDYTVTNSVATLTNGIPAGNIVVWVYSIT